MNRILEMARRRATVLIAVATATMLYAFTRIPEPAPAERNALASRFSFRKMAMPEMPGSQFRYVRDVHPSLRRISAWISAVGAAVALADIDGDGLSNDLCHVEPRTDEVIVSPVPGTGDRYAPFTLKPGPVPYNPATMAPMGCLVADLNEDGLPDFAVYFWGRTPIVYLRRSGTPEVSSRIRAANYVPVDILPTGERWYTNAMITADLDGDAHVDLIAGNYFQDGARILDATGSGVESMHDTKSKSYNGGHKHVLLWSGGIGAPFASVSFREIRGVFEEHVNRGWTLGMGAADLDGDQLPELYFAHDFGPDRLLHNRSTPGHPRFVLLEGKRRFTDPTSFRLNEDSFKGMGVDFGDVNEDGVLDIYVSNIADPFALQESHFLWLSLPHPERMQQGFAPYVQASEDLGLSRSGWGWDTRLADFDNDSRLEAVQATGFIKGKVNRWPELQALGTGNDQLMTDPGFWPGFRPGDDVSGGNRPAFFARHGTGRFHNIADRVGLAEPMVSRGIAVGDVDGDGRIDFVMANQFEPSFVFRNEAAGTGQFVGLHLLLPLRNGERLQARPGHPARDLYGRPAIGAAATVHLTDGRVPVAQVDGGSGHSGKKSPDVHFGLGRIAPGQMLKADLKWRTATGVRTRTIDIQPGWNTILLGEN